MTILEIKTKTILNADEKYIAHQCNCNTIKPHGLSQSLFSKYKYANIYEKRKKKGPNSTTQPDTPGTVIISKSPLFPDSNKIILNLLAQWLPSKPGKFNKYYPNTYEDTYENRKMWFQDCINNIDNMNLNEPVAIPYRIGCGLAGGNWKDYNAMLDNANTNFIVYKIE